MIVGIGMDIVEIPRMAEALRRGHGRLLERVFTAGEVADAGGAGESAELAARFAAKEAAFKAMGTGWSGGVAWRDVEVAREPSGGLALRITGRAAAIARERGIARASLALSLEVGLAAAVVVLEGEA